MAFDRTLALLVFHPTQGALLGKTPLIDTTIWGRIEIGRAPKAYARYAASTFKGDD